jgi:hypothetical protein
VVVSVTPINSGLRLHKPFFQAMFLAGREVKHVALVAMVAGNLIWMDFERMSKRDMSTSFDELDSHTKIIAPKPVPRPSFSDELGFSCSSRHRILPVSTP